MARAFPTSSGARRGCSSSASTPGLRAVAVQAHFGGGGLRGLSFKDNVFGRNTRVADCAIIAPGTTAPLLALTNNVYTDGVTVTVHRG